MKEEETKKLEFINENIIEKGYNPEEVANFTMKTFGVPFESLSLEKLKQVVEEFKDKGLNDTYKTVKLNEKKTEEKKNEQKENSKKKEKSEKIQTPLYAPDSYEVETGYQQENKLIELYRNNNLISIEVSEPQKEGKTGFFSKSYMTYRIQCPQLNSDVRRTYSDFEWFRNQLLIRYPLRVIPPIMKDNVLKQIGNVLKLESEEINEQRKLRYLNQFMSCLINKKIIRTSPILYEFLVLNNDLFKTYQNKLNNRKYELSISLDNLITMKGKIKCELKEDSITETNKNINKYNSFIDIYNKITSNIVNIAEDFNNLKNHMKQISLLYNKLNENIDQYKCNYTDDMKNVYTDFVKIFNNWSISFEKQSEYFNRDFKETFNYLGLEIGEMNSIYKKYIEYKNEYETFTNLVNKKKEQLFASKKIDQWNVEPGTEEDIPNFLGDKKTAFEKMLYKETLLLKEEKKRIACTIYLMNRQFDKLMKNQSKRIKIYYQSIKENAKIIFGNEQRLKDLTELDSSENK